MRRRMFLAAAGLGAWTALAAALRAQSTPNPTVDADGKLDLRTQLAQGLKARRPVEFAFVDRVVALVNAGMLPRDVVDATFAWARRKRDHRFQYFQFALTERAKKLGITL